MAGQPRKKRMVEELERRARRAGITTLEYAVEWVESGKTLAQLVTDINTKLNLAEEDACTRAMLYRYLSRDLEGSDELAQARSDGSHGMAESAVDIIDQPAENKVEAAQRKTQAEIRLKLAGFWNRAEYGEQKGPNVNLNFDLAQLHLDALRQRAVPTVHAQPALPPADGPDVEIVSDPS